MFAQMFACGVCAKEAPDDGGASLRELNENAPEVLVTHEGVATWSCPKGHSTSLVFQGGALGLLYERALQRLAKDATRDAVLDAFTALEMYLATVPERVRFEAQAGANLDTIREELKPAVKTSERATAAALVAIAIRSGKKPPSIPSWLNQTRNEATHQGLHPDAKDAEKLVLDVARIVREFEALFLESSTEGKPDYVGAALGRAHRLYRDKNPGADRVWTAYMPLALDLSCKPIPDAEKRLEEYRRGVCYFRLR
jgi:hypothetical protein